MKKMFTKTNHAYAIDRKDDEATLTLYGEIVEQVPVDWWTGEPVEGSFIALDEFLKDIENLIGVKKLTLRIHSYGGDAAVSITIHNRIRELARTGAEITAIVDGVAMSGGSLIMCACDHICVNPSSLVMVHNCISLLFGYYNANEMTEQAKQMTKWDEAQASIYARKTGMSEEAVLAMMAETTYMTGREAVERGFADELIEDAEPLQIAASADGRSVYVGSRQIHLAPGAFAPDFIPTRITEEKTPIPNTQDSHNDEGGDSMADIINATPILPQTEQINPGAISEAVQAERTRIREIDEIASLYSDELVREAKYGESACDARELAYRAACEQARKGQGFLSALDADADASGSAQVGAAAAPAEETFAPKTEEEKMEEARDAIGELLGKNKKEGK